MSHLFMPFVGQFDAVVGHHLMDLTILIAFGLRMSNQYDEPWFDHFDALVWTSLCCCCFFGNSGT